MPPQTNIRLDPDIKAQANAAADGRGVSLSRLIELALQAYLGGDTTLPPLAPVDTTLPQHVSDLAAKVDAIAARVAALEQGAGAAQTAGQTKATPPPRPEGAPKQPRQNRQQAAPKPPQASQQPPGEGLSVGQALIAAGAEISENHAMGTNRDSRMVTRYGMKAAPWLQAQGWQLRGRKWYPPGEG